MQEQDRLKYKKDELTQRWQKLSDDLSRIQEDYDNETRVEEKIRLESVINEKEQQRQVVEKKLNTLDVDKLTADAQLATKNKAHTKAIELWRYILKISPDNLQASTEISQLQQQLEQQQKAKRLTTQLYR